MTKKLTISYPTVKECFNKCPNCGSENIEWGDKEWMCNTATQGAVCEDCGCYFQECYEYYGTEFEVGAVKRIPCPYPLNNFYSYMDEVPNGVRVSLPEDCEKCEDSKECNMKHCLIGHPVKPNPVDNLLYASMEVIESFDNYGEVLQTDIDGGYGPESDIEKLRDAIKKYKDSL